MILAIVKVRNFNTHLLLLLYSSHQRSNFQLVTSDTKQIASKVVLCQHKSIDNGTLDYVTIDCQFSGCTLDHSQESSQ